MKYNCPSIKATLTLLPTLERSRWPNRAKYMPHIVLGDSSQRRPIVGPGNTIEERYLGVWILEAPDELVPGQANRVKLGLMYWPGERYDGAVPGATFTLREGPNIVGYGEILSHIEYL